MSERDASPPDGSVADETPGAAGKAITIGDILGVREAPPRTIHETMAAYFGTEARPVSESGRTVLKLTDPPALIAGWLRSMAGRDLGHAPTWIRLVRTDLQRGVVFVIHNPHLAGEAELLVLAEPGTLTRSAIRDACRWGFYGLGLGRIVVRIPVDRPDLSDLARRGGFKLEGVARRFFNDGLDAQVWAMHGLECPWLPRLPGASRPASEIPAPTNTRMH